MPVEIEMSRRSRLFVAIYAVSCFAGLAMLLTLILAAIGLGSFFSTHLLRWLPLVAATVIVAKAGFRWSRKRDAERVSA